MVFGVRAASRGCDNVNVPDALRRGVSQGLERLSFEWKVAAMPEPSEGVVSRQGPQCACQGGDQVLICPGRGRPQTRLDLGPGKLDG